MEHVLDNPAWNALITGNKHLANGNEFCRYFDEDVSPFAGLQQISPDHLLLLHKMLPPNSVKLLVATHEMQIPAEWKLLHYLKGIQMVYESDRELPDTSQAIKPLTLAHLPQMVALTQLTNPGPFAARTIAFGFYTGIFEGDELVAMAGQRLHAVPYAEISAVCTHPRHLGKGYARELLKYQVNRIRAAAGIPYLHVKHDNDRAINVYEHIGFSKRTDVHFYVLQS